SPSPSLPSFPTRRSSDLACAVSALFSLFAFGVLDSGDHNAARLWSLRFRSSIAGLARNAVSYLYPRRAVFRRTGIAQCLPRAYDRSGVGNNEFHHASDVDLLGSVFLGREFPARRTTLYQT